MEDTVTLQLAPAGAGKMYDAIWWTCVVVAIGVLLIGGIALIVAANKMRKPTTVTNVYPIA
jgi:TRAP-type C4-dicarboxylate transport system permease small subunit